MRAASEPGRAEDRLGQHGRSVDGDDADAQAASAAELEHPHGDPALHEHRREDVDLQHRAVDPEQSDREGLQPLGRHDCGDE